MIITPWVARRTASTVCLRNAPRRGRRKGRGVMGRLIQRKLVQQPLERVCIIDVGPAYSVRQIINTLTSLHTQALWWQ
jgi:hypothetical protein